MYARQMCWQTRAHNCQLINTVLRLFSRNNARKRYDNKLSAVFRHVDGRISCFSNLNKLYMKPLFENSRLYFQAAAT